MGREVSAEAQMEGVASSAPKKERVWEIDFLRGAAILGMVIDHFIFDLGSLRAYFVNFDELAGPRLSSFAIMMNDYFYGPVRQFFHSLAFLFFIMSGISCSFSHNNFRHGGKILFFSGLMTIFTYSLYFITNAFGEPLDIRIIFGVLYVLGMGCILVALIQMIPGSKWIELGLGTAILIFGFCWAIFVDFKGEIYDWNSFWNKFLYVYDSAPWFGMYSVQNAPDGFAAVTGFTVDRFFLSMLGFGKGGSDYFSLIPWIGFTLIGAFLGETVYKEKKSLLPKIDARWHKPIDWFGSKSLYVYALHQPFWLLVLLAIFLPMGFRIF